MADKRRYRFTEEKSSRGGIRSTRFALLSVVCFAVCVCVSFFFHGEAGPYIGALAVSGMLFSAYGFHLGMKSFGEKNVTPTFSVIGAILSGIVTIGWLTLFLTGAGSL